MNNEFTTGFYIVSNTAININMREPWFKRLVSRSLSWPTESMFLSIGHVKWKLRPAA